MISWDEAWERANEHDWKREDLSDAFAEWRDEWLETADEDELEGADEDVLWERFFDSYEFDLVKYKYAERLQSGDF